MGQESRKTEHAEAGGMSFYSDILMALRRINRPSFYVVIAIAISFLPIFGPQEKLNARVAEVTHQEPAQPVWQLDISGQESYRTVHLPSLYPKIQW